MKATLTAAALLLATPLALHAQQVYRCGSTYSQVPCDGGTAVKVDDSRSAAQAAGRTADTKREAKAADAMEKAREQQEARAATATVVQHTKPEPPATPTDKAQTKKKRGKKPDYFTAVAPKPARAPTPRPKAKTRP